MPPQGALRMLWPMFGARCSRATLLLIWSVLGAFVPGAAHAQAPRAQPNRVDYVIDVAVDTTTMRLSGSETVHFVNNTGAPTSELWFHLYWNGFASNTSTHLRESKGALDFDDGWGWQRVKSLRVLGVDLTSSLTYEHPDDDNVDDRTVLKVALPQPLESGSALDIALEWEAQIPKLRRRTGFKGNFLFIAQWFPKLGVFEGARGWNCHQFHAATEFFSDYGTYDVTIDLPVEYDDKIGATGKPEPAVRSGGRVRTRFLAPDPIDRQLVDAAGNSPLVHDFAWTADPDYKRMKRSFSADEWHTKYSRDVELVRNALGPQKNLALRSVEVTVLVQPEHERQWERYFKATSAALFFYGLWWGEYPYSHITVVDPAWGAGQAGGMEYPTLFTGGSRMWTTRPMQEPEGVTVHECGHQFWYGLVGNNEFESSWLDEGFNTYADSEVAARVFKRQLDTSEYFGVPFEGSALSPLPDASGLEGALSAQRIALPFGIELRPVRNDGFAAWWRDQPRLTFVEQWNDPRASDRIRFLTGPDRDPVDHVSFRYADHQSYRINSYQRPALVLRSLNAVVGHEAFLRGMRHYAELWRYRHPTPQDFFDSFCAGAGVDVHWYFEELLRGTDTIDWSVAVTQKAAAKPAGFTQASPTGEWTRSEAPQVAAPVDATHPKLPAAEPNWESTIMITRKGGLRLPLVIELRFDDRSSERITWSREEQSLSMWLALERSGTKKLVAALVDPDGLYPIDLDLSNNRWFEQRDTLAPWRWSERVFQRNLQLLHWQSGLGG